MADHGIYLNSQGRWQVPARLLHPMEVGKAGQSAQLDASGRFVIPSASFSDYQQAVDFVVRREEKLKR